MSRYLAYLARSRLISSRYAGNENGRGVANANSLAYYMADVRRFQPQMAAGGGKGGGPHRYPARWLRRLAAELLAPPAHTHGPAQPSPACRRRRSRP